MDKYIFIKRKVLTKDSCDHLIRVFEKSELHDNIRGYKYIEPNFQTSKFYFLKELLISKLAEYVRKHPFLRKPVGTTTVHLDNDFMIKKFFPGDFYAHSLVPEPKDGEHMEHGPFPYDCRRILAWMVYLNNIKHAGGTCWPQQNFISKPRAGDLNIWPAGWTHSHYGIPAPKENKYFMGGWFSLHD